MDWILPSALLSYFTTTERHTYESIAGQLKAVLIDWNFWHKVVAIVSTNMVNATVDLLKEKHVSCFVHTPNLGVQSGIRIIDTLHNQVKDVVAHFKRSTFAANKLKEIQEQQKDQTSD